MNIRSSLLLVLLIVIVLIGASYVLIFPGTHTGGEAAQAILDKEVLNGTTIHLSVNIISRSDTEFGKIRIVVDSPSDHRVVVNLTDIYWTENHSQVYPTSEGFIITLSRNGSHDYLLKGDSLDIGSTGEKLAKGNWTITLIYAPVGSVIAQSQQIIV